MALLKVEGHFTFSASIQPIPVASSDLVIPDGSLLRVSGYGETLAQPEDVTHLRAVSVPKLHLDRCIEKYANYPFPVTESMLCAGFVDGGQDACQGDSGGALTYNGVACGVVSWGIGCAQPGYPGVYASMAHAAKWIQDNIDQC